MVHWRQVPSRTFQVYEAIRRQNSKGQTRKSYVYEYYEVKPYWKQFSSNPKSPIARIINSLINAINGAHILPTYIVIMPDIDILKSLNYFGHGTSLVIGNCIAYLVNVITSIVDDRKHQMCHVKAGSVIAGEPEIIWVSLLGKPYYDKVMSLRCKYNEILEETLAMYQNCFIIHPTPILKSDFDRSNNLTSNGKEAFWKDIDENLTRFETKPQNFKPKKIVTKMMASKNLKGRKLAEPPPEKSSSDFKKSIHQEMKKFHNAS